MKSASTCLIIVASAYKNAFGIIKGLQLFTDCQGCQMEYLATSLLAEMASKLVLLVSTNSKNNATECHTGVSLLLYNSEQYKARKIMLVSFGTIHFQLGVALYS